MITFESTGDFRNTERFLKRMNSTDLLSALKSLAQEGVRALSAATPVESGLTAASWNYEITRTKGSASITWSNSHVVAGRPVAIMLQYGHGTGTGGYVQGRDYINPAIQPVMDRIAEDLWKVVTSA